MSAALRTLLATGLAALVRADLPVHCLRRQVAGEWRFVLGKPTANRTSCGHLKPDTEDGQPSFALVDGADAKTELVVQLESTNVARSNGKTGNWTMVYDEGFEVQLDGRVYFAFSKFTFENATMGVGKPRNISDCSKTMIGWFTDEDRAEFGCYYGEQQSATDAEAAPAVSKPHTVLAQDFVHHAAQRAMLSYDRPLDHAAQTAKVARLNRKLALLQLKWKARGMPQWNGLTLRQVNSYAGLKHRPRSSLPWPSQQPQQRRASAKSFLQRSVVERSDSLGSVPETWDWSNANGISFIEPVMDQGDCGSCYDAATMRMLTARHKINLNNTEALPWSINFPLFCSEFNQGCKGGFGFLTAKWSSDVGLIPATCMRYDTKGSCKLECDLKKELEGQKRYRAANHRYISSWYGNWAMDGEDAIKAELYRGGPLVLSFEPTEDFMFYSEGVFKSEEPKDPARKLLKNHVDYDQEWKQVDHAVVCVGYGEDDGDKYWLIQNSWGPDWGEDGFFRILRGQDESGVESIAEAADVIEDEQNGRQVDNLFAELSAAQANHLAAH